MKWINPQKARGKLVESMWDDPMWIADVKEDGDRRIAQFGDLGPRFTGTPSKTHGKPVEKTANLPHLTGPTGSDAHKLLNGTVLDGEIVAPWASDLPGGKSKYVTSIMGSKPIEAIRKQQEHGWLKYVVFDCIQYKGRLLMNTPLQVRREHVRQALRAWDNPHAQEVEWRAGVGKRRFYEGIVANGGEGVVLKHVHHMYGDEKLWVKVKEKKFADVIVMGFTHGNGKYAGTVGSIIFGQYVKTPGTRTFTLTRMGTCGGFDDATRAELKRRGMEKYVGTVMEISFIEREPTGAFRSPQWSRWRPDKQPTPNNCLHYPEET